MNSLRASGVMSFHAASAAEFVNSAARKSAGSVCTTPPGIRLPLTSPRLIVGRAASVDVVADDERVWNFSAAPPRVAPGVTSMIGYRSVSIPGELHRGMPSSTLTFIVSLDDGVEAAGTAEALPSARPNPLLLSGLQVEAAYVRQRRGQTGVQLAVHPLAARSLFGVPSAELNAAAWDATAVLGRKGVRLQQRVSEAGGWGDAFGWIAEYLSTAWRDDAGVRPEVTQAWHLLQLSGGRASVGGLADRVGITARHLTTLFHREVGRSPKTVAMLMRFERATARIAESVRRHAAVDLAAVAANTGYSDQAHLTREFARFAGAPPGRWIAEEFRNIQAGGHTFGADFDHDCF
jgi:AraC-like DNA-binding protein